MDKDLINQLFKSVQSMQNGKWTYPLAAEKPETEKY